MDIRINSYIPITSVEGPGKRFCIWVQGCSIHCRGCANSHMWDFNGGTAYDIDEIIKLIESYKDKIEGVTFLGGEPLEQIIPVTIISNAVKEMGLSIIVFTGYTYSQLAKNNNFKTLCKYIDVLIDGKYEQDNQDFSRPWVGSSNQKYHFITDRYNESIIKEYENKIELRVVKDKITITGMGDFSKLVNVI